MNAKQTAIRNAQTIVEYLYCLWNRASHDYDKFPKFISNMMRLTSQWYDDHPLFRMRAGDYACGRHPLSIGIMLPDITKIRNKATKYVNTTFIEYLEECRVLDNNQLVQVAAMIRYALLGLYKEEMGQMESEGVLLDSARMVKDLNRYRKKVREEILWRYADSYARLKKRNNDELAAAVQTIGPLRAKLQQKGVTMTNIHKDTYYAVEINDNTKKRICITIYATGVDDAKKQFGEWAIRWLDELDSENASDIIASMLADEPCNIPTQFRYDGKTYILVAQV